MITLNEAHICVYACYAAAYGVTNPSFEAKLLCKAELLCNPATGPAGYKTVVRNALQYSDHLKGVRFKLGFKQ